jgi:hypothetical protein
MARPVAVGREVALDRLAARVGDRIALNERLLWDNRFQITVTLRQRAAASTRRGADRGGARRDGVECEGSSVRALSNRHLLLHLRVFRFNDREFQMLFDRLPWLAERLSRLPRVVLHGLPIICSVRACTHTALLFHLLWSARHEPTVAGAPCRAADV